jgi:preprotein translocase SecF subunit
VGAVVALIHDVFLCVGLVALTDLLLPPELGINLDIGMSSLAAFLTVVGYSVNDSIVTFDRIREIIQESRNKTLRDIIDESINLNLSRTILTSVTTFLAAAVLFFVTASSGTDVASFAFPIMIGVVIGTFSSMFLASPLLVYSPLVGKPEETRASRMKQ